MQPKLFTICDFRVCSHIAHATTIGRGVNVQNEQIQKSGAGARVSSCCTSYVTNNPLPPSRLRGSAPRGRSLPLPTGQETTTNSRPTSQERASSKEENRQIRFGLQNLSDMIMNVSHRLDRMKESQESRPAKIANLSQPDSGRATTCQENEIREPPSSSNHSKPNEEAAHSGF